eukprot:TRINITY_DN21169_c0_g1_i2.p1 TRINITY_DN21169_c0_g1~~TRINITY_DN21169_c0_g1_i2.p1  ORF type:complete len:285 (-),score=73.88 TRINITY_DN21169_c0_g1_i2:42-863(-)
MAAAATSSSSSSTDLFELLSASVHVAKEAAKVVSGVFESGEFHAKDKASPTTQHTESKAAALSSLEDPQTIADLRAQNLIVGSLRSVFPNVKLVGEEGDLEIDQSNTIQPDLTYLRDHESKFSDDLRRIPTEELCLWVDPLDGTKEFVSGHVEAVTVLIGISRQGKAIAGAVVQPFGTKLAVWGAVGVGAYGYTRTEPSADRRVILSTRSHEAKEIDDLVERCKPTQRIKIGGAGGKVLMLLQGVADAYIHPTLGTKKWDTCAPEAVLIAAGT